MDRDKLCNLSLTEVAALIKSREVSPVEVLSAQLDRIQALDSGLKSYALVMGDAALATARAA